MKRVPGIKLFDGELNFLGETDQASSIRFSRSWQYFGDFEATLPFSEKLNAQLIKDNIITFGADGRKAYLITAVNPDESTNGNNIKVSGKHLDSLTDRRITIAHGAAANLGYSNVPELTYAGETLSDVPAETIYKTYIDRAMVTADSSRQIPNLIISDNLLRGKGTKWMSLGEKLSDVFQSIGEYTDSGYEFYIDLLNRIIVFDILPGRDLTSSQQDNRPVIFSLEFASVQSLGRSVDTSNYRNLAYAAGEGENADRTVMKYYSQDNEPSGIARREVWLDCGSLPVVESDTETSLQTEALHRLEDYTEDDEISFEASGLSSFAYGDDYDLGDLVTVRSRTLGLTVNRRISKIEEFYSINNHSLKITVGKSTKQFERRIKRFLKNS